VVGDHPSNMVATSLAFDAYAATGEGKYRDWLLEYVDAWMERTRANNGIIPSNIGLDGTIGGACDGKWYGGCYGWGFTTVVPQNGQLAHRNTVNLGIAGVGNAILLTGDRSYARVWGEMIDRINANSRVVDGQTMYPHMHGDEGWYHYQPAPYAQGALDVYYWTMEEKDRGRIKNNPWIDFLEGNNPDYPVEAFTRDFQTLRRKMEMMRDDPTTPDTRLSDNPNAINPATVGTLFQLMTGGPAPRRAQAVHSALRYFDPERRRPGIPEDVAALVDRITADTVSVTLVNLDPVEKRTVIVQSGAYGEHAIVAVEIESGSQSVDDTGFAACLAPGAGARLTLRIKRYAQQPTLKLPWT
jgi:hypothetical protein